MSDILLATKIHIPLLHDNLVNRAHLIQRLNEGVAKSRLTIISAPAGYGKSTLLSEWISQLDIPVAWLSLEKSENIPALFWSYIFTALSTVPQLNKICFIESLLQSLRSPEPPLMDLLLSNLLNDLTNLKEKSILVLDDLHTITESQIHHDLVFLIDHLPLTTMGLHVVVASRMDPPWPLARWRARSELVELRAAELRFNTEEATEFLNKRMMLDLSPENIYTLESQTEGWIAGLQMAALSLQSRLKGEGPLGVAHFIESFHGSNRFILDFLMEEVIAQQPVEMQNFLLQTCILDQFTAPLCNALQDQKDSQVFLDQAIEANLFLIPLDDECHWYRYHHLFAEHLRKQLRQTRPDYIPSLHLRASQWYQANSLSVQAIQHAIAAGDYTFAAEIIEKDIVFFTDYEELPVVFKLVDAFPNKILCSRPWLCIVKAWLFAYTGNSDQARFWLKIAEQAVLDIEKTEMGKHILGHMAAIHCYLLLYGNDMPLCIQKGYEALGYLPETDQPTRISTTIILSSALRVDGKMAEAINVLQEVIPLSRMLENDATTIRALIGLATAQFESGRLHDAVITFNDAIKLSERVNPDGSISHLPPASNAYNRLGDTFYCMNDLDSALECVKVGIMLAEKWGRASAVWDGNMYITRILKSLGDYEGANLALQKAENISRKISDQCKRTTDAIRALFWLDRGEIDAALRWAEQQDFSNISKITFDDIDILLIYARVLLIRNDIHNALNLLNSLLATAEQAGAQTYKIEISIDLALAYQKGGLHEEAIGALIRAVKIGERIDHVRIFIDRGKALQPLFDEIMTRGISVEFVKMLLVQIDKGSRHEKKGITASPQKLIEPLSERELQVLRLLDSPLTSEEISRELFISVSTTRTHIRNIYSKLGVHGRIEALQKSRELGLI